ncbi:MAG: PAN domain-containing protein [Paracoccaceae bacterium]
MLFRALMTGAFFFTMISAASPQSVDPTIFAHSVNRQMEDRVKGYAFAIANKNKVVAEAAGGWAQAPRDGNLRMSARIPAGWGSNQKVLSGIALLDLLERRNMPLQQSLDTPMRFFVPDRWIQAYFNQPFREGLSLITLRDLLDHTSALPQEKDGGSHGTRIARALFEGNSAISHSRNEREYNNHNYTLMLYIIPALANPGAVDRIEREAEGLSLRDYNRRVAREYGRLYTRYMHDIFLSQIPGVNGSCQPGNFPGNRFAKEYNSRTDMRGETDNAAHFCRSQGSWFYSARDMANIHRTIEFTNTFVKRSTRRLYRVKASGPRMIYWRTYRHDVLSTEVGQGFRAHGGLTRFGTTSVSIRLPFGHVGVGIANSREMNVDQLANVMLAAFYEATRTKFEQQTNRPGQDIRDFTQLAPDPQICADACANRADCQSWTYVLPGEQHPIAARCWLKSATPAPREAEHAVSGIKGAQYNTDRPGANLRFQTIGRDDPALCRLLCTAETDCKSWTFVPSGGQGPEPRCWLKRETPGPIRALGLVSGIVR